MVEIHVGHYRHAAVPRVRRIQPAAEPHLDERDIRPDLGEAGEDDGGQQLEFGRLPVTHGDAVRDRQHPLHEPGEVLGGDRAPIDLDPLAVGDEMGLGGRPDVVAGGPQRGIGQGQDAALAVGPRDQRAADRPLRVIEGLEQGARPAETQPDAEPAARRQRAEGGSVGETGRRTGHREPVTRGSVRPRRRRTG